MGYSLLSPTSPAEQSYVKITYTSRSVLTYENGYDGDSAPVKRSYRSVLYRRLHSHGYICIFLRVRTAKCISCTSWTWEPPVVFKGGQYDDVVASTRLDRNGAVCPVRFCLFIAALNGKTIGTFRMFQDNSII